MSSAELFSCSPQCNRDIGGLECSRTSAVGALFNTGCMLSANCHTSALEGYPREGERPSRNSFTRRRLMSRQLQRPGNRTLRRDLLVAPRTPQLGVPVNQGSPPRLQTDTSFTPKLSTV